ncbi:Stp1/IreP family PP2C-type Ser/Thr phosphatase [Nitriliruptor alkaliphilus]|uniref:Stp1/IreP family PP2C-type Ser/Thr phosphatase n=1 Tax=Nitriliruptor alkaliphilus TaxID=427918 RepID=UPI0006985B5E|nr:Stp1/IreP family PP2C-type Ser/Thr phosphatase [Nitriliruptor alkaliphilus]
MTKSTPVASGMTDVGRVREANEDAFLVGESIVAVADGMGGHLAGEVASATALEPVKALDGRAFEDGPAAINALRDAVIEANATVSRMAEEEPTYRGMGTTLTAALLEGRRLHLAHVGDSRAYLLRGDRFSQLTDDHTLVQHLVDEGQITREEAATHPQRSIITRAIGVSPEVDVDALSLELDPGDQLLLCSDGLTGVVEDDAIARMLAARDDPDETLKRLIDAANAGGGPDNVTAVLLRYGEAPTVAGGAAPDQDATGPIGGPDPAAGGGGRAAPVVIGTRTDTEDGDWARRLGNYGALTPGGPGATTGGDDTRGERTVGRTLGRLLVVLLGVAILGGLALLGGRFLIDRSYYVGLDGDQVVIYRGVDLTLGPLELGRVFERTELTVDEVPTWYAEALEDGVTAADLVDARRIVENAPRRDEPNGGTDTDADPES